MNNTIFSPFNQPGTLGKAITTGVEEKERIGRGFKRSSNGKPVAVAKTA